MRWRGEWRVEGGCVRGVDQIGMVTQVVWRCLVDYILIIICGGQDM